MLFDSTNLPDATELPDTETPIYDYYEGDN